MDAYEQNLHIGDQAFESMRHDADKVLQRLLKNMVEKDSMDGSITIKVDVKLTPEYIQNQNPDIDGETRKILLPAFTHKVGSVMQIKDEAKGGINYEQMEMVWDDELKEFVVKPVANARQRSIFDADFQEMYGGTGEKEAEEPAGLPDNILGLPDEADCEDVTDAIIGVGSDDDTDDYDYEDPE